MEAISVNDTIRKRKSIRKYELSDLDAGLLESVQSKMAQVEPLYPDIGVLIEIARKTKGIFGIAAPHYLVFGSEEKEGAYENIGFIGQQMDLFFSEAGIGACWLGMAKHETNMIGGYPFVICMAFGKPAELLHRNLSDFKRKSLSEISEGVDERLEAARLAPSAKNTQGWFFVAQDGVIHCFRKRNTLMPDKLSSIDLGIAICHIATESGEFSFGKDSAAPVRKGFIYVGTVGA